MLKGRIEINGISFEPLEGITYKHDYVRIIADIKKGVLGNEINVYRELILNDLFFLVFFGLKVAIANHAFVIKACRDVEDGDKTKTIDLWAREHFKSTIITKAEIIQKILRNKEERVGIFSHTRPAAKSFLRSIKLILETSLFLKTCFPDVLFGNPTVESPKWSEDDGLICKREGFYNEATVEAWGLLEGMPTGKHFTHRVYDDIETADVVENPDTIRKLVDRFDLSQNLGTMDGTERIVGTTYHYAGVLVYLKDKTNMDGKRVYITRIKAATDDGTPSGKPVLLSENKINELKCNEYLFACQQLLNPSPIGVRKLDSSLVKEIEYSFIPKDIYKFLVIDPAGDSKNGKGDSWAIECWGVEPSADDVGASNIYLLDAIISPLRESEAVEEITRIYMRNGMIQQVGIEKVGLSTTEVHVANALAKKGRHISVENRTLAILRPAGRDKVKRIESALAWPLYNSKIFLSKDVPEVYRNRFRTEMDKFPYWHDDALDAASYLYDIIKEYRFAGHGDVHIPEYEPVNALVGY